MINHQIPHVLLDTNILINLVSKHSYGVLLKYIKTLVEAGQISLLVPVALVEEWDRNKGDKKKRVLKDIADEASRQSTTHHERANYTQAQVDRLVKNLEDQISDIDNLLKNGIEIDRSDLINSYIYLQQKNHKAPFHRPKTPVPHGDAEIIYSSLLYCKSKRITELFFCSDNYDDFSVSKYRKEELNTDYRDSFPEIDIHYFRDSRPLLIKLDSMGIRIIAENENSQDEEPDLEEPFVDKSLPILEQVFTYLKQVFDEVSIMPKQFFTERYPFLLGKKEHYEQPFTIVTDNDEVFSLLQVKVIDGQVSDPSGKFIFQKQDEEMIQYILRKLVDNNISKVSMRNQPAVELEYSEQHRTCNCCQCRYQRLDWVESIQEVYQEQEEELFIDERMKRAYVKYRLGDFKSSALDFESIYLNADTTPMLRYICAFNLIRLNRLFWHEATNEGDIHLLQNRINSIDLEDVKNACTQSKPLAKGFIQWIHDLKFLTETDAVLRESESNVRDHFYSQSSGNNEYTLNAIESYGHTERLLHANFLVFDKFSEFSKLTRSFIEILYASYGCSDQMGGRLIHFSDNLLRSLVFNGDNGSVRKYGLRYKTHEATYFHSSTDNFQFISAVHRFFLQYHSLQTEGPKWKGFFYENMLRSISLQIFQLLSTLKINTAEWTLLTEGMHQFFSAPEKIDFRIFSEIKRLLLNKGDMFNAGFLAKMMELLISKKELHNEDLSYGLSTELHKRGNYKLDENNFQQVLNKFLDHCPECNRDHSATMVLDFWLLMDENQKQIVKELLTSQLVENFSPFNYYRYVMNEIIDIIPSLHDKYLQYGYDAINSKEPRPWFISPRNFADSRIDEFLNYSFKFQIVIPEDISESLKSRSNYYKWLLSPDTFDYNNFDENWLGVHFTIHYKKRFTQSKLLQDYMLQRLKTRSSDIIEKKYLQIYVLPLYT